MIVLSEHDVRGLLDMESCVDAMTEVLASLARGELYNPLRSIARPDGVDTLLGLMPAYRAAPTAAYALKEIVIVPTNPSWSRTPPMWVSRPRDGLVGTITISFSA